MKRTYKINEIASKMRRTQATLVEWSNQFGEFLPTVAVNGTLRYTPEAFKMFQIIAKLKAVHTPNKLIKDHLQDVVNKTVVTVNKEEKTALPPTRLSVSEDKEPSNEQPPNFEKKSETLELRNMAQLLTKKIDEKPAFQRLKDLSDEANQLVGISSLSSSRRLHPTVDYTQTRFEHLTSEVAELRNLICSLTEIVMDVSEEVNKSGKFITMVETLTRQHTEVTEEVAELRNLIKLFTNKVVEAIEQINSSGINASIDTLNLQVERVSDEVKELNNGLQTAEQRTSEALENQRVELLTATESLLSQQYTAVSEEVVVLRHQFLTFIEQDNKREVAARLEQVNVQIASVADEVQGLQNELQTMQLKLAEDAELDLKGDILTATEALLSQQFVSISEEIAGLRMQVNEIAEQDNRSEVNASIDQVNFQIASVADEVQGLQNELQTIQLKLAEDAELDLKGDILTSTEALLSQQFVGISEEIAGLRMRVNEIAQQDDRSEVAASIDQVNLQIASVADEVQGLQNELQTVQLKLTEDAGLDLKGDILTATEALLSQQFVGVSEEIAGLRIRVDEIAQQDDRSEVAARIDQVNVQIVSVADEIQGLQNELQTVQQKLTETSEQDLKGEILDVTKELLGRQYEGVSEEIEELHNVILLNRQIVLTELEQDFQNKISVSVEPIDQRYQVVSDEVVDLRNAYENLTLKVTELLEQVVVQRASSKEEEILQRVENVSLQVTSQQLVLDKIARFLGN